MMFPSVFCSQSEPGPPGGSPGSGTPRGRATRGHRAPHWGWGQVKLRLGQGLMGAAGLGGLWSGETGLETGPAVAWEGWPGTARASSGLEYPHNQQLYQQKMFSG